MKTLLMFLITLMVCVCFSRESLSKQRYLEVSLSELEQLVGISEHLEPSAKIAIAIPRKKQKDRQSSCLCSCQDQMWICTQIDCKLHERECSQP